jgi:glucose/arabinose dehydrogenase
VNTVGERGVSGLAVDPQFATTGRIYVAYTTAAIRIGCRNSPWSAIRPRWAPRSFMESPDTVANYHHGGGLAFGPDGKLYWGKGDNQVGANAQDLTNMYGKILRFKSDGSTPSDNPVLPAGSLPQIYAYGLRNPFRLNSPRPASCSSPTWVTRRSTN